MDPPTGATPTGLSAYRAVMGLHASAMTAGGALAASGTGLMIDIWTPATAVLVVGGIGVAAAAVSGALARASPRRAPPSARSQPA